MIIKILGTKAETTKEPKPYLGKFKPSCLIKYLDNVILIDVGDDIFNKLTKDELLSVNSILITHGHEDAIGGLHKLNEFYDDNNVIINLYAHQAVIDRIKNRWVGKLSSFQFKKIKADEKYNIGGLDIYTLKVFHDKKFPTLAFNFEKVFLYAPDMGPVFDEYKLEYFSNNILAVIDGAYWDRQIQLHNHIAVLPNLEFLLSLNNKYLLFTGMGNQYPPFDEADKILKDKLEDYKKEHKDIKTIEVRTAKEGEQFEIDLNKYYSLNYPNSLILKPGFDEILNNPEILLSISNKELISLHLRCHQLWGLLKNKEITKDKILEVHILVVKEMLKRGLNHNIVNDLDELTYQRLGNKAKIFKIWKELEDNIVVQSNVIKFVGSSLELDNPNDLDIIASKELEKIILSYFKKYNPHFLGPDSTHGELCNAYDLVLKKKENPIIINTHLPDYNKLYKSSKIVDSLRLNYDTYIIEPYIDGISKIIVDKENRIIYEQVEKDGKVIITDLLAYKKCNLFNEILINRLYFMLKKWLDKVNQNYLIPIRWYVKKDKLIEFLKGISKDYNVVIIRPASSKYYDGKFVACLKDMIFECNTCDYSTISNKFLTKCPRCNSKLRINKRNIKKLQPLEVFTPLKASGSAYHEIEYFNPDDAWEYFIKYGVENEGKVRAELKIDGWRCILSQDKNKNSLIYFEDSKENRSKVLPSIVEELKTLHSEGIILDAELMELSKNNTWLSRHDLMKWSQAKDPGPDDNVRIFVFDILYYGKDLHNLPLSERVKILKEVSKKFKKHFILVPHFDIKSKEEIVKLFKYYEENVDKLNFGRLHGIDGFMLKYYSSNYPLNGRTLSWCKLKYALEANVIVLDKVVNRAGNYNYIVGYNIPQSKKDNFTPIKELNGRFYGVLGKTFNTKINAEIGQILNIAAAEYKKEIIEDKVKYTLFQARVITIKPDLKEPDDYLVIDRMSVLRTKSFYDFFILSDEENRTGQWTIEEGMTGKYTIQCHTRGIRPIFIDLLTDKDIKNYGLNPDYFIPNNDDLKKLVDLYPEITLEQWKEAIDIAKKPEESSSELNNYIDKLLKAVDFDNLPKDIKKIIALLDPVSIHQDIRLVPDGTDYFEGGHWPTPGNQFKENRLLKINEHIYVQFMIKVPHVDEEVRVKEPVVRGPASWIYIGVEEPLIVPPDSIGSTTENYASFWAHDTGTWIAGRQTSPHGSHYKLFKFNGKLLNGWYIFMYAPLQDKRIWLFYKPKNQDKYEETKSVLTEDIDFIYKFLYSNKFKF